MDPVKQVYTIKEVAGILAVSTRHVQRMVGLGDLPSIHLGPQTIRIPVREFQQWLDTTTGEAVAVQKRRRNPGCAGT